MGWQAMAARTLRTALRTFRQDVGVLYERSGYVDVVIKDVVYDESFFGFDEVGNTVAVKNPIMGVSTADLPTPRDSERDTIVLNGIRFNITNVQPDGEAGTTLFLTKSSRQC